MKAPSVKLILNYFTFIVKWLVCNKCNRCRASNYFINTKVSALPAQRKTNPTKALMEIFSDILNYSSAFID